MRKTLDDNTIDQITTKLSHFLADTFVCYVKTLNFHWNMRGKGFYMYHLLLESHYKEIAEDIDELAERIRALGRRAPASMGEYLKLACLKESSSDLSKDEMVQELIRNHEAMVEHCHELMKFTDDVYDQGTSDLLNKIIRSHSKQAWMLRSHQETAP